VTTTKRRAMQYRKLGACGTRVSEFGLGGWLTFGKSIAEGNDASSVLHAAFDAGVNYFDIADAYAKGEAERVMGRVLSEIPRHRLVIATKLFWPMSEDPNDRGLSRKHIRESVEKSLKRIGTDYLDVYFCHRFDPETPVEETARAMDDLVHEGKVLYWGTSEWTGAQLRAARDTCEARNLYRPQVEQPQYNLIERAKVEKDVRPAAVECGMGLVTWSPLASGMLSGKYDAGVPKGSRLAELDWLREGLVTTKNRERVQAFGRLADEAGCTRSQLALAWTGAQPGISSVILGVTSLAQLEENLGALDVTITPEVASRIDAIFP
jgi:voltage-dependent potassium channel beta subunit